MFKGDVINGYYILKDFSTTGGGLSKWSFARKGGKEYFIKEFLAPKYPTPDAPGSEQSKERKRQECEKFEKHHQALMKQVNEKCGTGGNLVFTIDFFRVNSKYYKVTEKVDVTSLSIPEIAALPLTKRIIILKTIAHSLSILHKADIVHGDLKPDNILIKQTKLHSFTSKLIDFDNSYFSTQPPEIIDDLVGDMVFYSPELAQYIKKDPTIQPQDLTTKSDIFALGLIYSLYLTGELPFFDKEKYNYACIAVLSGQTLTLHDPTHTIPKELIQLINRMLLKDYHLRPSIEEVFNLLKEIDLSASLPAESKTDTSHSPLKGGLLTSSKSELNKLLESIKDKKTTPDTPKKEKDKEKDESTTNTSKLRGKGLEIGKKT
ncbi:MAG: protein kinase [Microscillaceae bacterium]|nr:protein kinase [Microscillaceae bacterium]MDW8459775.1 protein kinase [Cytophagales bacterium]